MWVKYIKKAAYETEKNSAKMHQENKVYKTSLCI